MRELFSDTPSPLPTEPEETVYVDPTLGEEPAHWRWEARAAQWRAMELAEHVFGGEVSARLSGRSGRTPFRGLLHLDVPFADLDTHRAREAVFLASAAVDPILARVPFVYVLGPAAR
jgi:hypothetical protein